MEASCVPWKKEGMWTLVNTDHLLQYSHHSNFIFLASLCVETRWQIPQATVKGTGLLAWLPSLARACWT